MTVLPDRLAPGQRVVFCGTAPGRVSAARGHYYAGPGNLFWPMLAETGLTPRRLRPEEDAQVTAYGIGLTDLAKDASGGDHEIPRAAYDVPRLLAAVGAVRPRALAFTSLTAGRLVLGPRAQAGMQAPFAALPGTTVWVLPSPSGRARGRFDAGPWRALGDWVRAA